MNKPTTKSIFIKRMKDSGYLVDHLIEFSESDLRKWQILLDKGNSNLFITCYKNNLIEFYDGEQFYESKFLLDTSSVDVIFQYLNDHGTINKHPYYSLKTSEKTDK